MSQDEREELVSELSVNSISGDYRALWVHADKMSYIARRLLPTATTGRYESQQRHKVIHLVSVRCLASASLAS